MNMIGPEDAPLRRIGRHGLRAALALWAVAVCAIGSTLMVSHWVPLPVPAASRLRVAVAELVPPGSAGTWCALHVLMADCPCSRRIADHLLASERPAGLTETVVLVGDDATLAARLRGAGFAVVGVAAERLARRYGIEGVPLMVVADAGGSVRYAGGYTDRKQGLAVHDREVIATLRAGGKAAIPVFGCGASQSLQDVLDPLGIKY